MSASTSSSELSDRTHGFDKNATTEDVLAWILEYACKYGQNDVVKALSAGDPKQLLQFGILEGRLVGYLLWSCVTENVVEGYDLCVQLLRHTYTHAPLVNFSHYARILYGLKVKVMLHILADRFELCLASSKLKELFPKDGEKLPPVLKHDATLERQLNQLNRRSGQFRQLALDLILDREKREAYLRHEVEEEFGAEFSLALHDLVAKFVQTVEDYLPAPVIQEICSSELYLTPPDGCSHAVSSLLTVLEATNGNPSAANLTQLVHELHNVSTTKTKKRNCSPGRNEVKLHSSFKSPKTKDRKAELRGNCSMRLQFKGRGSATQGSTSTESSDSVCSGVTPIPQSDSSNEELSQVSSELHSDCSTGGKKETKTRKQNCSPGRKEVKLSKPHSSFKHPERKEKTVKSHVNSSVRPKSKERQSATQESTSTESSDSQRTVCSGVSILSDSSSEELLQVSSELRTNCSSGGKNETRLPKETGSTNVTGVNASLRNKKLCIGTKTKGSETEDSATNVEVLNKVEEKAQPRMSWNSWKNSLRKHLVGSSNSRGSKDLESFPVEKQEMQVSTEDSSDEMKFSQGNRGEASQGNDSVNYDKIGAEKRTIRNEDESLRVKDLASPIVITLDSSTDEDMVTSPLLFAHLEEDPTWKTTKRQREDEQLSTEHSKKRRKLDLQENISEKSSTNIVQVPEANMQKKTLKRNKKTLNVDKTQVQEKGCENHERKYTAEEVANQSSCSSELAADDKAKKSEDEDTCAEGDETSQVSMFASAERHSVEEVQETPMESTNSCSTVGSRGDTQPFSPVLQEATLNKDDSTSITECTDTGTTLEAKDKDNLKHKGSNESSTEEVRPSQEAGRFSLANVSFSGSTTSDTTQRQDFPLTPMDTTPCANAEEHIDASPHGKEEEDSLEQWDKMVHWAIQSTPTGVASLADICQYITENFPHHSSLDIVAQSVCRVLSTHKCFQVVCGPREIKWTLSATCGHKSLSGPSLVPTDLERESSPENSDVTSSTPDGVDSATKALTSNLSREDIQTLNSMMEEEEEKNLLPDSESTCMTTEEETVVLSNKVPERGADRCSDNTVSSSQDDKSNVQCTFSFSSSNNSNSCTFDRILNKAELEDLEERDTMLTSPPYFEKPEQINNKLRMAHTDSENSGIVLTSPPYFEKPEQINNKLRMAHTDSENSGTEKGSHSQSSDESIIPPSPQEEQRAKVVTFTRTRRALLAAVPHTCRKAEQEVCSLVEGGEDMIVSDSDSDSESTVLYYQENEEESDTESYVIPNSHEQDDSFGSVSGPKAPLLGVSTRSALWTKNNTLVPSLSQHLSPCPVRPCVVLLHRLRPDDLRPHLKKS